MKKSSLIGAVGLLIIGALGFGMLPLAAQEPPPPIATELLTPRSAFTDNIDLKVKINTGHGTEVVNALDPSRTVTARFTIQPGARFPWHTHAGTVFVNVVQGSLNLHRDRLQRAGIPDGDRLRRFWTRPRPFRTQPQH